MAPLAERFASARRAARRTRIRGTAIERELGSVYTADTLAALVRRFPEKRFIWLMGGDNLAIPPLARLAEDRRAGTDCGRDPAGL